MIPFSSYYAMHNQINGEPIMNMVSVEERFIEWEIEQSKYFYLPMISDKIRELKKCLE